MTVREMIENLQKMPPHVEVMVEYKGDPCDVCAKINHYCDTAKWKLFADVPYLHEASEEVRITVY